jgi:hypothetical protein
MDSSRRGATLGRVPTGPEVKRAGKKMERVFRFAVTSFAGDGGGDSGGGWFRINLRDAF